MDLYLRAGRVLDGVSAHQGSVASLANRNASSPGDVKRMLALCLEAVKYKDVLERIIARVKLLELEKAIFRQTAPAQGSKGKGKTTAATPSPNSLAVLLVHDLLFAKRGLALPKEHRVRLALERHTVRLRAEKEREKVRTGVTTDSGLQASVPRDELAEQREVDAETSTAPSGSIRWMRINELAWTIDEALVWLQDHGWPRLASIAAVSSSTSRAFVIDEHLPELLAFPAHALPLSTFGPYLDGSLIAQDKASCMPARVLFGDGGDIDDLCVAIDATAAPGNKTSHLAALLQPYGGRVHAFERNKDRFETLRSMCSKARCSNVRPILGDFLSQDPVKSAALMQATLILVDPSCWIPSRTDSHDPADAGRLASLARFQATILRFALSLPSARRVVYSTCSVHTVENEGVVRDVLARADVRKRGWRVAPREAVLPSWPHRGDIEACEADEVLAGGMIRCEAKRDKTNGFFVCLFTRTP